MVDARGLTLLKLFYAERAEIARAILRKIGGQAGIRTRDCVVRGRRDPTSPHAHVPSFAMFIENEHAKLVDVMGVEPTAFCMPCRCAPKYTSRPTNPTRRPLEAACPRGSKFWWPHQESNPDLRGRSSPRSPLRHKAEMEPPSSEPRAHATLTSQAA